MKNYIMQIFNPENDFFQLTKDSKRITHIWLSSFILPVIFLVLAGVLTQFVFAPLFFGDPKLASSSAREAFGLYALFGSIIILIFLWVRFYEGRQFFTIGFTKEKAVKRYLLGFGSGLLMNSLVVGVLAILNCIEITDSNIFSYGINNFSFVVIFLLGYIIQGASEEILTRGWMFQVIGSRYKPWLGFIITTIFFAILHLGNDGVNLLAVINLLFVAIFLILLVIKNSSIWASCGWHSAWNWSLGNVYGLSVSGTKDKASIFNLNTTGDTILSGGGFGPEASIITTFILFLAVVWLALKIKNNLLTQTL